MTDERVGRFTEVKKAAGKFPLADYAEALLDSCVESETLKEIPFVSTGVATLKLFLQYKEGKFKKKVKSFVDAVGEMSSDEWAAFSVSLEKEGRKEQFINELLEIIEQVSSEQKAKILGGVFRRLVKEEIEYAQFEDQVRITNDMLTLHIHNFMHGYHNSYILEESLGDVLVPYRMARRKVEIATKSINMLAGETEQYIKTSYEITGIGFSYLVSLHQVYKEKIEPRHLYTGQLVTQ
ncbi:hypothetical protein LOY55_09890 [Pseudomonas sp. B21-040]|uniref:hypothetical protein n=1 Tax=Pseudomonas sp. B21-040 TaxID=2895486 RepID=UPI00215F888F|nr:hypothetical protein [Pseudomonas sp. B21-040]UVL42390.1 hypothetical protein LOY55_09890 [Pseudomonas sp. B21-040]